MAVSRVKDTAWYETADFEDDTLYLVTISTKAFLIDVRNEKFRQTFPHQKKKKKKKKKKKNLTIFGDLDSIDG